MTQTNQIPTKPTTELERRFFPLFNIPFLEMEGNKVYNYYADDNSSPEISPLILTYNGKTYDLNSYLESRKHWSTEGYTDEFGNQYLYPPYPHRNENGAPHRENHDYPYIEGGWATYQHRVRRAYQPLTITALNGDVFELPGLLLPNPEGQKAWCTERNLEQMLRETYPEYKCLQNPFKLVMFEEPAVINNQDDSIDLTFLDHDKWKLLVDGNMPLELMLVYLDEEEVIKEKHLRNRQSTPLQIIQDNKPDEILTLENWAELPLFEKNWINIQHKIQDKYPELKNSTILLQINLPSQKYPSQIKPEFINRIDPITRQRILEAEIPLVVKMSVR